MSGRPSSASCLAHYWLRVVYSTYQPVICKSKEGDMGDAFFQFWKPSWQRKQTIMAWPVSEPWDLLFVSAPPVFGQLSAAILSLTTHLSAMSHIRHLQPSRPSAGPNTCDQLTTTRSCRVHHLKRLTTCEVSRGLNWLNHIRARLTVSNAGFEGFQSL